MAYYGYRYRSDGSYFLPVKLATTQAVARFIQDNLEAPQLIVTDAQDSQLLLMRDGVDLFNELGQIGISLNSLLSQLRQEIVKDVAPPQEKPEWERLYDQIGLSLGEIRMRQRAKAACRAARTVADAADLVRGTYFDAHFLTSDGQTWYRYFNPDTFEATPMTKDHVGEWIEELTPAVLSPTAQIRYLRSSEDIHTFEIKH